MRTSITKTSFHPYDWLDCFKETVHHIDTYRAWLFFLSLDDMIDRASTKPRSFSSIRNSLFFIVSVLVLFISTRTNAQREFENKDELMKELDRLSKFTETRIQNKKDVLLARKRALDREEELDKTIDGLELEDKLERQFESDLAQVRELGTIEE